MDVAITSILDALAFTAWIISLMVVIIVPLMKVFQTRFVSKLFAKKMSLETFFEFILWPLFVLPQVKVSKKEIIVFIVSLIILISSINYLSERGILKSDSDGGAAIYSSE